jgi:hypothetical protein|nr:hypothetical protein [Phenylobacterium sp.]
MAFTFAAAARPHFDHARRSKFRFAGLAAGALALAGLLGAGSAQAAGGIRTDQFGLDKFSSPTLCTLGQSCTTPTDIGFTVNGVSSLYVYKEGIVGLGAALSGGTTLDTVVGDYLAPALGATADTVTKQFRIERFEGATGGGPGITLLNFTVGPPSGVTGVYQIAFFDNNVAASPPPDNGIVTGNQTVTIAFYYGLTTACGPDLGADCGFNATSQAGYRVGSLQKTFAVGVIPDVSITLPKGAAVPEPNAWALMLTGFAFAGAALRRARRRPALASIGR